jgi:hypothetical protein
LTGTVEIPFILNRTAASKPPPGFTPAVFLPCLRGTSNRRINLMARPNDNAEPQVKWTSGHDLPVHIGGASFIGMQKESLSGVTIRYQTGK